MSKKKKKKKKLHFSNISISIYDTNSKEMVRFLSVNNKNKTLCTNTHCNVIQEFGHMLNNFTMVRWLGLQQFLNDNNTFSNYNFCLRQNKLLILKAFMQKKKA